MSIQSEINRIEQNIANAYSTLSARGATLPAEQNSENLASTISEIGGADWNQNDSTHPDYIENRTHYVVKAHDFSYSGPYNWKEIDPGNIYYAKGMRYYAVLGLFEDESFGSGFVPSLCDFSNIRGSSLSEIPRDTVIHKNGINFLWSAVKAYSNYCEIYLYRGVDGSDFAPTMANFTTLKQLSDAYIPSTIARTSDITSGTLPIAQGGTGATDAATARSNLGITPANIGAAASSHKQAASTITQGTFAGSVMANATKSALIGTAQMRNIYAGTSDMITGTSSLSGGTIYLVYE